MFSVDVCCQQLFNTRHKPVLSGTNTDLIKSFTSFVEGSSYTINKLSTGVRFIKVILQIVVFHRFHVFSAQLSNGNK